VSQLHHATGWLNFNNSPDYFNGCSSLNVDVPNNWAGNQIPASGDAYVGVYTCGNGDNYREYLGAQLISPLIVGQTYYVSFLVSRGDNYSLFSYDSNNQGALFTNMQYSSSSPLATGNVAHVYASLIVSDSINWIRIFGSYLADSAYNYIALGNFFNDSNTSTTGSGSQYAYYYYDNICVSTDSLYASSYEWTSITEPVLESLTVFPNPADNFISIGIDNRESQTLFVYNSLHQQIFQTFCGDVKEVRIDCSQWPSGIYFIHSGNAFSKTIIHHP
jgi:hypothetical protein